MSTTRLARQALRLQLSGVELKDDSSLQSVLGN